MSLPPLPPPLSYPFAFVDDSAGGDVIWGATSINIDKECFAGGTFRAPCSGTKIKLSKIARNDSATKRRIPATAALGARRYAPFNFIQRPPADTAAAGRPAAANSIKLPSSSDGLMTISEEWPNRMLTTISEGWLAVLWGQAGLNVLEKWNRLLRH
ncbi:hypothetical protein EVAR_66784_1 [Eumeta japonica]|uniref:Uncharacterized protein n=1 Tax=Eumeta variegata TaxID=151549 RepID=A0A4C1ZM51_EUMVA|nr:hypothetical protein EVAR_66784_1 [Eumeta japonica]